MFMFKTIVGKKKIFKILLSKYYKTVTLLLTGMRTAVVALIPGCDIIIIIIFISSSSSSSVCSKFMFLFVCTVSTQVQLLFFCFRQWLILVNLLKNKHTVIVL